MRRWFPVLANLRAANVVTTVGAACGLAAISCAARDLPRAALLLLMGAILGDKLDGAVARRLGQASDFGRELDSLADALNFCIAPALIGWFRHLPTWAMPAAAFYSLAGLWRLAHFNISGLAGEGKDERFTGVPTTIAASWFVLATVALDHAPVAAGTRAAIFAAIYVALGLLMISAWPFRKHGPGTRSLYLLLPAAAAVTLFG
jgi:CDP-diacylglycerol--serine O-phosphatidyltransferase